MSNAINIESFKDQLIEKKFCAIDANHNWACISDI